MSGRELAAKVKSLDNTKFRGDGKATEESHRQEELMIVTFTILESNQ